MQTKLATNSHNKFKGFCFCGFQKRETKDVRELLWKSYSKLERQEIINSRVVCSLGKGFKPYAYSETLTIKNIKHFNGSNKSETRMIDK